MQILVVDNEVEIGNRLQRELCKEGHEVECIISPIKVLEELKRARRDGDPYELLLLNIEMPEMDGLTLLSHIREEHLDIEVIVVSGYREEHTVIRAIRLSAQDYIPKPISLEKLNTVISDIQKKRIDIKNINKKYRILVVDDEKSLCARIRHELDKEGYQTAVAYTGKGCIDYFRNNTADLVIADVKMPGMSGLEMLKQCKEISDDFVSIIITGHGNYDTAIEALKLETHDYLKKPLSLDQLLKSVKKGIERLNTLRAISALREEKR